MSYQDKLKPVATSTPQGGYASKLTAVKGSTPIPEPKKEDGFLASIAKDALKTLLVKPADRLAETVGRTGILGKNIKTGYETMADEGKGRSFAGIEVEPQKAFGEGGGKQILGDAAKSASYLYTGGSAPGVIGAGLKGNLGRAAGHGAKVGAISGGLYGGGESIQQDDASLGSVLGDTATGAALGGATGGVLGGATSIAQRKIVQQLEKRQNAVRDSVERIIQSKKPGDTKKATEALSQLDIDDVKSYTDLRNKAQQQVKLIQDAKDAAFDTNKETKKLADLAYSIDVGEERVAKNFVEDALDQLQDFYIKTNDVKAATEITQLRNKANDVGLTIREVDELARRHGSDLNAYNASGELASGLTKQASENTREGLKETARSNFGSDLAKKADGEMHKLIKVIDLAEKMEESVQKLRSKIMDRGLMGELGHFLVNAADFVSGGFLKGATRALLTPRGQGYNTLNALDLENQLQKNLQIIQKAIKAEDKGAIIRELEKFVENANK